MSEEKKIKIVVIGGSIGGLTAAKRARRISELAEITIIEESKYIGGTNSALPFYTSGNIKKIETLYTEDEEELEEIYNIKLLKNYKAIDINRKEKKVIVKNLAIEKNIEIPYDKLVLACGSRFKLPKIVQKKIKNVFVLNSIQDAIEIREYTEKTSAKEILIVGSNYYSLITADSFIKKGFNVSLIDKKLIGLQEFDFEFNHILREEMKNKGIILYNNLSIKKFIKNDKEKISKVELNNNQTIDTHLILFYDNYLPNIELAKKAALDLGETERIKVDNKMITVDQDIFAIGSIAESYNRITNLPESSNFMIPVQIQARVAGSVAAGQEMIYKGSIKITVIKFQDFVIGSAGLNIQALNKIGIDNYSVTLFAGDHERYQPINEKLHIKILINKENRRILGAQICGKSIKVDKKLDLLYTAIYSNLTIDDLQMLGLSYTPELSYSKNPINTLGMIATNRMDGLTEVLTINDILLESKLFILDIRNKDEYTKSHVEGSTWIPLNELRKRLDEIPKDINIYICGHVGIRGYIAERILKGNGFKNVFNIEGGITAIKLMENMR